MNINDYKAAFDSVKFSKDFENDAIEAMLRAADRKTLKEDNEMKTHKALRITVIAAALVALLALSAFAINALLTPREVASHAGENKLSEAFDSNKAVNINESQTLGEYNLTVEGLVSGSKLTQNCPEADPNRSYIVASLAYSDGRKFADISEGDISMTPVISGYKPWQVNAWTLGGGYVGFLADGVKYYIFDCSNIEVFADHDIYLAAYVGSGTPPSSKILKIDDKGNISFNESYTEPHAMFKLPIDKSKADPAKAKELLKSSGMPIE
ncbi:MAG: hypothetical protein Q8865_10185 [Bacillota bacterium]|nr:hypothetical protein [Bacillota bacterium]